MMNDANEYSAISTNHHAQASLFMPKLSKDGFTGLAAQWHFQHKKQATSCHGRFKYVGACNAANNKQNAHFSVVFVEIISDSPQPSAERSF